MAGSLYSFASPDATGLKLRKTASEIYVYQALSPAAELPVPEELCGKLTVSKPGVNTQMHIPKTYGDKESGLFFSNPAKNIDRASRMAGNSSSLAGFSGVVRGESGADREFVSRALSQSVKNWNTGDLRFQPGDKKSNELLAAERLNLSTEEIGANFSHSQTTTSLDMESSLVDGRSGPHVDDEGVAGRRQKNGRPTEVMQMAGLLAELEIGSLKKPDPRAQADGAYSIFTGGELESLNNEGSRDFVMAKTSSDRTYFAGTGSRLGEVGAAISGSRRWGGEGSEGRQNTDGGGMQLREELFSRIEAQFGHHLQGKPQFQSQGHHLPPSLPVPAATKVPPENRRRVARGPRSDGSQDLEPMYTEDHRVLKVEKHEDGKEAFVWVTLLAAGFVIGSSGAAARQIGHVTGAVVQSWTETAVGLEGMDGEEIRKFRIQGKKEKVERVINLIHDAVDKYKELCDRKREGQFVLREHRIDGVDFQYQPPPRKALQNRGPGSGSSMNHHTSFGVSRSPPQLRQSISSNPEVRHHIDLPPQHDDPLMDFHQQLYLQQREEQRLYAELQHHQQRSVQHQHAWLLAQKMKSMASHRQQQQHQQMLQQKSGGQALKGERHNFDGNVRGRGELMTGVPFQSSSFVPEDLPRGGFAEGNPRQASLSLSFQKPSRHGGQIGQAGRWHQQEQFNFASESASTSSAPLESFATADINDYTYRASRGGFGPFGSTNSWLFPEHLPSADFGPAGVPGRHQGGFDGVSARDVNVNPGFGRNADSFQEFLASDEAQKRVNNPQNSAGVLNTMGAGDMPWDRRHGGQEGNMGIFLGNSGVVESKMNPDNTQGQPPVAFSSQWQNLMLPGIWQGSTHSTGSSGRHSGNPERGENVGRGVVEDFSGLSSYASPQTVTSVHDLLTHSGSFGSHDLQSSFSSSLPNSSSIINDESIAGGGVISADRIKMQGVNPATSVPSFINTSSFSSTPKQQSGSPSPSMFGALEGSQGTPHPQSMSGPFGLSSLFPPVALKRGKDGTSNMGLGSNLAASLTPNPVPVASAKPEALCAICTSRPVGAQLLPCNHAVVCMICCSAVSRCPLCGSIAEGQMALYVPNDAASETIHKASIMLRDGERKDGPAYNLSVLSLAAEPFTHGGEMSKIGTGSSISNAGHQS